MRPEYKDILDRIPYAPTWFDDHGVPRYCAMHPDKLGVYDDEAVFYRIRCQACGEEFNVGQGSSFLSGRRMREEFERGLDPYYGDPPRHVDRRTGSTRCAGDTMVSDTIGILAYWQREHGGDWERVDLDGMGEKMHKFEGRIGLADPASPPTE